jgi:DNA-binding CsgD family transcriptional regulator
LAGGSDGKKRARRSYRPSVETMEALRLLSSAPSATALMGLVAEHDLLADPGASSLPLPQRPPVSSATWDAALVHTQFANLLSDSVSAATATSTLETTAEPAAVDSGLAQLDRYLSRTWYRAAIPAQLHDDCTQAVYATLLQQLGRAQFEALLGDVDRSGIKEVFSRETSEGLDFFRAVDMVKKRAQRERVHQSLEALDVPAPAADSQTKAWREALSEAIAKSLSPREASLINETLMGKTPAEIALHWGVASKTISNEKTRVLAKLRDVLSAQTTD